MPRFYCNVSLSVGEALNLPDASARHVQVLRMQPGDCITLFNAQAGHNHEFTAEIVEMGRQHVQVKVISCQSVNRESATRVHLLAGMPSNDRMDWLVEKATELGAASLTPIAAERSMLKLKGERAQKKQAHWQSVAISACEQCGRNTVPFVANPTKGVADWLQWHQAQKAQMEATSAAHKELSEVEINLYIVLTPQGAQQSLAQWWQQTQQTQHAKNATSHGEPSEVARTNIYVLTGPEGGLSEAELHMVVAAGFTPVSLGQRVLRSETAPLAALSLLLLGE